MHYSEFNPGVVSFKFDGESHDLKPFSLGERTRIANYFKRSEEVTTEQSLEVIENVLKYKDVTYQEYFNTVCDLIFIMVEDDSFFLSPCHFKKTIQKVQEKDNQIVERLKYFIDINISNSLVIQSKKTDEQGSSQPENSEPEEIPVIDWVKIYVTVSRQIKFTLKEFYELTMRQIFSILQEVAEQKHNEYLNQLRANGIPILNQGEKTNGKKKSYLDQPSKFGKEEDDFFEKLAQDEMTNINPLDEKQIAKDKLKNG